MCNHLKGKTRMTSSDYFNLSPQFAKKPSKSVNQSEHVMQLKKHHFKTKQKKQPRCVKVGYGPLNFGGNQGALWEIREW